MFSLIIALLAVLGPKEILELSPKELAQKIASADAADGLAVAGTVAGVTSVFLYLACIIRNHKTLLTSHLDHLRTELCKVKTDFNVAKSVIHVKVNESMK